MNIENIKSKSFKHWKYKRGLSFIEVDFSTLENVHVVHLEEIGLEDLDISKVTSKIECLHPDFVVVDTKTREVDGLSFFVGEFDGIVMILLIDAVDDLLGELTVESDVETR